MRLDDGITPDPEVGSLGDIARSFTLSDRLTSARVLWNPNEEQDCVWELCARHPWVMIAKPRKTGISTAGEFDDLLAINDLDDAGNRVRGVFAIDVDPKALEHLERCADFASQAQMRVRPRFSAPYGLRFPNGSRLDFLTLGSDEPGRGGDIHRLHITELPYAAHPEKAYHSLRSACADNARGLLETTMTSADEFTTALWRGQRRDPASKKQVAIAPEYVRRFFSVENHKSYRLPMLEDKPADTAASTHLLPIKEDDGRTWKTATLSAEQWAFCIENGFHLREAGAWWMLYALPTLCAGDLLTLMHDYPQHEPHLFVASTGRAILIVPELAPIVDRFTLHGISGRQWHLEVYIRPSETSGHHFVTVDTAFGIGKSNSVVLVVDIADGRICACFTSNTIDTDDLARMAQLARARYLEGKGKRRCDVWIENNGIGQETVKDAIRIGLPHGVIDQSKTFNDHGAHACVKLAKRAIETVHGPGFCGDHQNDKANAPGCPACGVIAARVGKSLVAGPVELQAEVDALRKVGNEFEGYKDVVMALGMALLKRHESGVRDEKADRRKRQNPLERVYVEDRMAEQRRLYRHRGPGRHV